MPEPPVPVEPPLRAPAVPEPPVVAPPLLAGVVEPPVPVLPPLLVVFEPPLLPPAAELLPPLALLLAGAELPPVGVLLVLLVFPEEPPWVEVVLGVELPPVAPLSPPESLEQDTTSAGRPTHKVAKSSFLIGDPPNRERRTGTRELQLAVNPETRVQTYVLALDAGFCERTSQKLSVGVPNAIFDALSFARAGIHCRRAGE
jgi:hypothetical protein